MNDHPNIHDVVCLKLRTRVRGGWGEVERLTLSVDEAAPLIRASRGKNFNNTRPGDRVVIAVGGTLTAIFDAKIKAGYTPDEL